MRTLALVVSVALLLFFGVSGIQSFLGDWGLAETVSQRLANLGQLVFAVAGLTAGTGAILKRGWTGKATLVFAGAVAFTAWAGPVAWGEAGIFRSLLDGVLGFLVGCVLYLGVRGVGKTGSQVREPTTAEPPLP